MPMPKPGSDEGHDEFIERCMSDSVMMGEFSDEKQRLAVCEGVWDDTRTIGIGGIERRSHVTLISATRAVPEDGSAAKLIGYASVFNQLSEDFGGFREQVAPGAFTESIERDDIRALFNHDPSILLGRNMAKTLSLQEDAKGLLVEIIMPTTRMAEDLLVSVMRGDVNQMSFGFTLRPNGEDWAQDDSGVWIRTLKRTRLFDVSVVTYPAYPQTSVAKRSLRRQIECAQRVTVNRERVALMQRQLETELSVQVQSLSR